MGDHVQSVAQEGTSIDEELVGQILIAEDDADLRETLRRALTQDGYRVCLVADGAEAVSHIKRRPHDLLIVDLVMPHMGGIRLMEQLRGLGLAMPTIVITAYGDRFSYNRAVELGASEFLMKPLKLVELFRAVRRVLAGG